MILAIDLGSTSFKAAVFDDALHRLGAGACDLSYQYGPDGLVELDPRHVDLALAGAVRRALAECNSPSLTAVGLTSQAQTFTVTDHAFAPRLPFISWLDARARGACDALRRDPALRDVAPHASFPALLPGMQMCHLRRLRDTQPGLLADDARVLLLPAYITAKLCGCPTCDTNLAAMSGLYSMAGQAWWPPALSACALETRALPALLPVGSVAGRTTAAAASFGLPPGLPLILAGNDQTAGAYGAGVHESGALLLTLGTCQVAYRAPAGPPPVPRTTAVGPYPGGVLYAMAADSCGGNLINWAKTILAGCETDARFFAAAAAAPPGCRGLIVDVGPSGVDLAWRCMTAEQTVGDFARAIIETLVRRLVELVEAVEDTQPAPAILVAGGGRQSGLWLSLLSESLGRKLSPTEADPLLGAARMALSATRLAVKSTHIHRNPCGD